MEMDVKVFPYLLRFTIAYFAALLVFALAAMLLDLNAGTGSSFGALIAAAAFAMSKFVSDHERAPTHDERSRLTWLSLGASILVSAVLVAPLVLATGQLSELSQVLSQLNVALVLGVALFVLVIYVAVLWFSYGGLAKVMVKSQARKRG